MLLHFCVPNGLPCSGAEQGSKYFTVDDVTRVFAGRLLTAAGVLLIVAAAVEAVAAETAAVEAAVVEAVAVEAVAVAVEVVAVVDTAAVRCLKTCCCLSWQGG